MRGSISVLVVVIVGLAVLLPFTSEYPDGFETVVDIAGVEEPEGFWHGVMPDYFFPIVENPYFSTLISGLMGILLVLLFAFLVGKLSTTKR